MIKKEKICDRCGAEMKFGVFPRSHKRLTGTIYFGLGDFDYNDESYDLCKKCCKAFNSFMKGGEGNG